MELAMLDRFIDKLVKSFALIFFIGWIIQSGPENPTQLQSGLIGLAQMICVMGVLAIWLLN
jgi:hypothetical protein